ncbi:MAG: GIY-YIG nuclease family protein, partial [Acetivibrio ethanolgignens]
MGKGVIYILTNPSFPDYVKIGYAKNLAKRMSQLNRSETIPFAFRAYAVYEVDSNLTDIVLHDLIDRLNPDLRSIENFDGKERKREFYAMAPEEAYALLECIAKISGTEDRLKKMAPEGHEILDEETAAEVTKEAKRG